jgi:hypothetical protein
MVNGFLVETKINHVNNAVKSYTLLEPVFKFISPHI